MQNIARMAHNDREHELIEAANAASKENIKIRFRLALALVVFPRIFPVCALAYRGFKTRDVFGAGI